MKKKRTLFVVILLFAFTPAWADSLDVCLPWNEVQYVVPINTYYADWGFENEFIYPASRVGEMAGGSITQIIFYAVRDSLDFPETFLLRMEEVADTATQPLSWVHTDAMRLVWTGSVSIRDSLWIITLDTVHRYIQRTGTVAHSIGREDKGGRRQAMRRKGNPTIDNMLLIGIAAGEGVVTRGLGAKNILARHEAIILSQSSEREQQVATHVGESRVEGDSP